MKETKLRKALDTIALKHSEGVVSDDFLAKACENYKHAIGFNDDYAYEVIVAKSCFDYINGIEPDPAFEKAVLPGQTKVIDQVVYQYSKTAPGSKTPYAWHVLQRKKNAPVIGKQLGLTQSLSAANILNSLFPNDPASLTHVKRLGGSTGATLVQDAAGNQYVQKKDNAMTGVEHVKTEYLANQVYDLMGLRVPNYELYTDDDGNGKETVTLLSQYMPMMQAPGISNYAEMAKGFIADVVLANWDVYQNDNCLVNAAGQVFRVDNGSCFNFRAQGKQKPYDHDVKKTYRDMISHNPLIFQQLNDDDIVSQIDAMTAKKDEIVAYVELAAGKSLAATVGKRIENLQDIKSMIEGKKAAKNRVIVPRKLKPAKEMYRTFTDDELKEFWDNMNSYGSSYHSKLTATGSNGWKLLEDICKARGFDARPRVIDDKEYEKEIVNDKNRIQLFRGIQSDGITDAQFYMDQYRYNDTCFFGSQAAWGQGIYSHVNDGTKKERKNVNLTTSSAFNQAVVYYTTGRDKDAVLFMGLEKDAKVAKVADLQKEILSNPPVNTHQSEVAELEKEKIKVKTDIDQTEDNLYNFTDNERKRIYQQMHYDEDAIAEMQADISSIDWGEVDDKGNFKYPSYDEVVLSTLAECVKKNGGKVKTENDVTIFSLPNSRNKFTLSKYQYEHNAIKHANPAASYYNLPVQRFEQWFQTEHTLKVEQVFEDAKKNMGDKVNELKDKLQELNKKYREIEDEQQKLSNPDPDADIYSAIYARVKAGGYDAIGLYAAIKGYDALLQPNGNGGLNTYCIILNRSKTIVRK